MNYYELTFTYTSPVETSIINDVLAAELGEIGFESFAENENGLQGYISDQLYNVKGLQDKLAEFPLENVDIHFTETLVESKDWNEEWEKNYFKPIRIGKDCIIRASFHEHEPGYAYNIIIDPKMAFGTGFQRLSGIWHQHRLVRTDHARIPQKPVTGFQLFRRSSHLYLIGRLFQVRFAGSNLPGKAGLRHIDSQWIFFHLQPEVLHFDGRIGRTSRPS